MNIVTTVVIFN